MARLLRLMIEVSHDSDGFTRHAKMSGVSSACPLKDWTEGGVAEVRGEFLILIFRFPYDVDGKVDSLTLIHSLLLFNSFVKEGLTLRSKF